MNNSDKLKKLNELFGSYRAEWLKGKIYQFFTEPSYFTALRVIALAYYKEEGALEKLLF
ncbi:MAG: hypothetical protein LRY34_03505 [Bacteroides graminisolvens]|nr:hypothetical protein [Bacteroides graminisolvens]